MAWWSLQAALESTSIDEIVLVCGAHSIGAGVALANSAPRSKPLAVVRGGLRRQDSARAGVEACDPQTDIVAIHDAARPLVTPSLFDAVIATAASVGAAIAATEVIDTIKRVHEGRVVSTLPRDELICVQTPQAFRRALLIDAFAFADDQRSTVTDESALIEAAGGEVAIVPGLRENIKVTFPSDLETVEMLIRMRRE